jgi:hypothetical protein
MYHMHLNNTNNLYFETYANTLVRNKGNVALLLVLYADSVAISLFRPIHHSQYILAVYEIQFHIIMLYYYRSFVSQTWPCL